MSQRETPEPEEVRRAFQDVYARDLMGRGVRSLAHYQKLFPDHPAIVAEEYFLLEEDERGDDVDDEDASDGETIGAETIGPYEILDILGRGGQAVVYLARHATLDRKVALKVAHASALELRSESQVRRIQREASMTAQLNHPGICSIYETGEDNGHIYIAMQYVQGDTLAKKIVASSESQERHTVALQEPGTLEDVPQDDDSSGISSGRQDLMRILHFIEHAARALHVAHEHHLIHRDIKPGNIIVTQEGNPVLLDFGMARQGGIVAHTLTRPGDLMGTPYYMSPEQLLAQRVPLDRSTDVYSMGVTLYECLTLHRPFDAPSREALYHQILINDVPDPRGYNRHVTRDLKIVLETAMDRDRSRRYQTALAFAEDLRRVQNFEPPKARPLPLMLRLKRWIQRHPAVAAAMIVLVFGVLATTNALLDARKERWKTEQVSERLRRRLYAFDITAARNALANRQIDGVERLLQKCDPKSRGWEWHRLNWIRNRSDRTIRLTKRLTSFALDPGCTRFIGGEENGDLRAWSLATGEELWHRRVHESEVSDLRYRNEGREIVSIGADGAVKVLESEGGRLTETLRNLPSGFSEARLDPCGRRAAVLGPSETLNIWDLGTDARPEPLWAAGSPREMHGLAWSEDGQYLASAGSGLWIWDTRSARVVCSIPDHSKVDKVVFHPDGRLVAYQAFDKSYSVRVLNVGSFGEHHASSISAPAALGFAKGPETLVVMGERSVLLRRLGSRSDFDSFGIPEVRGDARMVVTPDASRLLRVSAHAIELWDLATGSDTLRRRHPGIRYHALAASSDGSVLATDNYDHSGFTLWDSDSGELMKTFAKSAASVRCLAFDPKGDRIISGDRDGALTVWNRATGAVERTWKGHQEVYAVDISPDGRLVVSGGVEGTVRVWELLSGTLVQDCRGHTSAVNGVAFDPKGQWFVSGSYDCSLRVWDVGTPEPRRVLRSQANVSCLAVGPQGRKVYSGSGTGELRIWDIEDGTLVHTIPLGGREIWAVAASPDGSRLAAGTETRGIILVDPETAEEVFEHRPLGTNAKSVTFMGPRGARIACTSPGNLEILDTGPPACGFVARSLVRRAHQRVAGLYARHVLTQEVLEALHVDPDLDPKILAQAERIAVQWGDGPFGLSEKSWRIVAEQPAATPEDYRLAVRMSLRACEVFPNDRALTSILGCAQYVAGDLEAAGTSLTRADHLNQVSSRPTTRARELVFLTLTLHGLGRTEDAQATWRAFQESRDRILRGESPPMPRRLGGQLARYIERAEQLHLGTGAPNR